MAGPIRVLIIEDNPDDAELVAEELRRTFGDVTWERVDSAEGVRRALAERRWDAVISDYKMQGFDGLRALEIFQSSGTEVPFMLVSGTIGEDTAVEAMQAGASYYVTKDRLKRLGPALDQALRQAEERRARRGAEAALHAAEQRMRLHFEQTPVGVIERDTDLRVLVWNPAAERIFGFSREEAVGRRTIDLIVPPPARPEVEQLWRDISAGRAEARVTQESITKDGRTILCEWHHTALADSSGKVVGFASLVQDVTERHEAERRIQKQLDRLASLRKIDSAITGSLDLRLVLGVLLDQVTSRLGVDAAGVLLYRPQARVFEYAAGRGFRTRAIEESRVRPGEGVAGGIALQRRILLVPDLRAEQSFTRAGLLAGEGFHSYAGAPLIAKGEIRGILEVYHRTRLDPEPDWLPFLETIADLAAIAIDNASMFEGLQSAHADLALTFDATLEALAGAADVREGRADGHTPRAAEASVILGERLGVPEAELVHIRRGALLHDVGGIFIPDAAHGGTGPLTDEGQKEVRSHPTMVPEIFAGVAELRAAMAIPSGHHERWDGTGYPRGLAGEQIPLPARVFAVADAWEAMRLGQPGGPALPTAEARARLRRQAGAQLDPQVVEAFLEMLEAGTLA